MRVLRAAALLHHARQVVPVVGVVDQRVRRRTLDRRDLCLEVSFQEGDDAGKLRQAQVVGLRVLHRFLKKA